MAQAPARRPGLIIALALGVVALLAAAALIVAGRGGAGIAGDRPILLFTTLPILWPETPRIGDALNPDAPVHWALAVLRETGEVHPLDALADADGSPAIGPAQLLVMAQPRPLSGQENVAIDGWVRGGGRVLLFADPMLTAASSYAIGDPRRPQDVALLSPILRRWGLELTFDEDQPPGETVVAVAGGPAPVNLAGRFASTGPAGTHCVIRDAGLVAQCAVGNGSATAVADAALFEMAGDTDLRSAALRRLLQIARSSSSREIPPPGPGK